MIYDFDKNSRELLVKKYAGGKGYSLFKMANNDIPVPYFRILGSNAFANFIHDSGLKTQIDQLIKPLGKGMTIAQGNRIHQKIQTLFLDSEFPTDVEKAINRIIDEFDHRVIAVRSSAVGEDAGAHSFAGQLMSYLYLNEKTQIKKAIKKCWASAYTGRCLAYRSSMKLSNDNIAIAVILQEMIDPDVSGVMFTQNALNAKPREIR